MSRRALLECGMKGAGTQAPLPPSVYTTSIGDAIFYRANHNSHRLARHKVSRGCEVWLERL